MSVYAGDRPAFFVDCLASLANQERKADEIVLVEDGPLTERLERVIAEHERVLKIVRVRLPENCGLGKALSAGLARCNGDLVARMDSDDVCRPERFERQVATFSRDPSLDVLGSFATEIDDAGRHGRLRVMPVEHEQIVANLWANPFIHGSVMFKRARIIDAGGYRPSLRRRQDYELWFRCASFGLRFANIPEPLLLYRFSAATHQRQPVALAWQQALIGYHGTSRVGLAYWKRLACFAPFVRSLVPSPAQHVLYRLMSLLDPRSRTRRPT